MFHARFGNKNTFSFIIIIIIIIILQQKKEEKKGNKNVNLERRGYKRLQLICIHRILFCFPSAKETNKKVVKLLKTKGGGILC
jgi:CRISPR/Cas system-associated protein endoribonuclease Cas2